MPIKPSVECKNCGTTLTDIYRDMFELKLCSRCFEEDYVTEE